jgi:hypothetical protein
MTESIKDFKDLEARPTNHPIAQWLFTVHVGAEESGISDFQLICSEAARPSEFRISTFETGGKGGNIVPQ